MRKKGSSRTVGSSARFLDLASKGWAQGLSALQHPRDLFNFVRWVGVERVHLGELVGLYPCRGLLRELDPKTVIDVGANTGQFSSVMGALLPNARIYAFEPIEQCRQKCLRRMKGHPDFYSFNVGVGEANETRELKISSFTESSSFLDMSSLHQDAFPWTVKSAPSVVEVVTLDSFMPDFVLEPPILLKIDVQGFEMQVLRGAAELIRSVDMIIVETAFQRLYEGQALFDQLYNFLCNEGFRYVGSVQNMLDSKSGQILQADSLFLR